MSKLKEFENFFADCDAELQRQENNLLEKENEQSKLNNTYEKIFKEIDRLSSKYKSHLLDRGIKMTIENNKTDTLMLKLSYKDNFQYKFLATRQNTPPKLDISINNEFGTFVREPMGDIKDNTPEFIAETVIQRFIERYIKAANKHEGVS